MKKAVPFRGSFQTFSKQWDSEISVIFRMLKKSTFRGFGYRKASKKEVKLVPFGSFVWGE